MKILPGNEAWNQPRWEITIKNREGAQHFLNAFFKPFHGANLNSAAKGALCMCPLLTFSLLPPGSGVSDTELPPDLVAASLTELGTVVVDLAQGYVSLPSGFRPSRRVIIEDLLPVFEEQSRVCKCALCLHPSTRCACGGGWTCIQPVGLQYSQPPLRASMAPMGSQVITSTFFGGAQLQVPATVPSMGASYAGAVTSQTPPPLPPGIQMPHPLWTLAMYKDLRLTFEYTEPPQQPSTQRGHA